MYKWLSAYILSQEFQQLVQDTRTRQSRKPYSDQEYAEYRGRQVHRMRTIITEAFKGAEARRASFSQARGINWESLTNEMFERVVNTFRFSGDEMYVIMNMVIPEEIDPETPIGHVSFLREYSPRDKATITVDLGKYSLTVKKVRYIRAAFQYLNNR